MTVKLTFDRGTLELTGLSPKADGEPLPGVLWDPRTGSCRAPAYRMAEIEQVLSRCGIATLGTAAAWPRPGGRFAPPPLRPYQQAALDAWEIAGHRGLLVLPTGAGKTRIALAAIARLEVATLCLVPTRILLHQWYTQLCGLYDAGVGCLGDGTRRLRPITVATYESAYRYMARIGHRFALLVVDEAHHFGIGQRDELLEMSVAPMRLGLTATPITELQARAQSDRLIGREVFRIGVLDLVGRYLAELELVTLTADNDAAYAIAREHLVMPITCDIARAERDRALALFREGRLRALVSSRVLNEGLDLPDADVAIIVGSSQGAREHVQRIGRVLRPREGKRAVVYELLSRGTSELSRAERRRSGLVTRTPVSQGAAGERAQAKLPGSA